MTYAQFTRLTNWSAIAIALSLVALVSYQLYMRHYAEQQISQNYQFDDLPGTAEAPVTANIDAIINKHIFGEVPKVVENVEPKVVKVAPKPAPKTRLNIKLTGVIDGTTPENGMAMMEVDRGRTIVVAVGEKIDKTDAVLHQVLPGEILIDRGGSIESVKMVRKTLSIAKLQSELYDSLPQPYVETGEVEKYRAKAVRRSKSTGSGRPLSASGSETAGLQARGDQAGSNNTQTMPDIERTPRKPMKQLPVPRMLQ